MFFDEKVKALAKETAEKIMSSDETKLHDNLNKAHSKFKELMVIDNGVMLKSKLIYLNQLVKIDHTKIKDRTLKLQAIIIYELIKKWIRNEK